MMTTDLVNPSLVFKNRQCYACGSNTTHIKRTRTGRPYPGWYCNRIEGQYLCEPCENHLIKGPRYHHLTNPRRNKKHNKFCNCDLNGQSVVVAEVQNYSPTSMKKEVSQFVHQNKHKTNKQQSDCGGSVI
jgi:hypothetical protein